MQTVDLVLKNAKYLTDSVENGCVGLKKQV